MTDTTGNEPSDPRQLRASDADREKVAQALHQAAGEGRLDLDELQERLDTVYSSRTYGELEPVVSDLPGVASGVVVPAVPAEPARLSRVSRVQPDANDSTAPIVGVLSGPSRRGDWLVPRTQVVVAFMGGVQLDLREARFAANEVTIQAYAVMGGIEIDVPEDITVRVDGIGIMGGFDDHASGAGDGTGPTVHITGFAFWGGVDIKLKRRKKRKRDRDRD